MYECEYCRKKRLKSKQSMKKHEQMCFWNPETRSCMTCQNYMNIDDATLFKVVDETTVCIYANDTTLFYTNCVG